LQTVRKFAHSLSLTHRLTQSLTEKKTEENYFLFEERKKKIVFLSTTAWKERERGKKEVRQK